MIRADLKVSNQALDMLSSTIGRGKKNHSNVISVKMAKFQQIGSLQNRIGNLRSIPVLVLVFRALRSFEFLMSYF